MDWKDLALKASEQINKENLDSKCLVGDRSVEGYQME